MMLGVAESSWTPICAFEQLTPERGVCALVEGQQVAVFRVGEDVFALSNYDPFSGAYVLSRGIVGSSGAFLKVTSPIYKQAFDLRTGRCLDDPAIRVRSFATRVMNGVVEVGDAHSEVHSEAHLEAALK